MLILGLLLILLSAAAGVLALVYNFSGGPEQMVTLFGRDLFNVTPAQAFIGGLVLSLIFCLGVWMVVATERRRRVVRGQYRDARREARVAARERDKLAAELAKRDEAWSEPGEPVTTPTPVQSTTPPATAPTAATPPPAAPPVESGEEEKAPRSRFGRHFRKSEGRSEVTTTPPSQ